MAFVKCFTCGRMNSTDNITCEGCGSNLLKGKEYEEKIYELKNYEEYRKKYGLLGIILGILILLLFYLLLKWLFAVIIPLSSTNSLPPIISAYILEYGTSVLILLFFLLAVLPLILGRLRIWRRYRWTRERMRCLEREIRCLAGDSFIANIHGGGETKTATRTNQGPPVILLIIVFTLIVLVYLNKYTDFKPLDSIISLSGTSGFRIGTAQKVSGQYECHYEQKNLGGGVARSDQTWALSFRSDGFYTSYLNNSQQFSGKWSQTGNTLTLYIPTIAGLNNKPSAVQAKVSADGNKIIWGERTYTRVK